MFFSPYHLFSGQDAESEKGFVLACFSAFFAFFASLREAVFFILTQRRKERKGRF